MHTNFKNSATFYFNDDMSGEVIIVDKKGNEVRVNVEDVINFIKEEAGLDEISGE